MNYQTFFCAFLSVLCFVTIRQIKCANILYLSTFPSPSHEIWNRAFAKALGKQHHNVTYLSTETARNLGPTVHTIYLEKTYEVLHHIMPPSDLVELRKMSDGDELSVFSTFTNAACDGGLQSNGLKVLMNYPDDFKFDLIIDDYSGGPCFLFLAKQFNYPPIVGVTAFGNPPFTIDIVGGHHYYAYVPYYRLESDGSLNFWQRIQNAYLNIRHIRERRNAIAYQDKLVRKTLNINFPYLGNIEKQIALALVNTHPAVDFPEPLPPNVIPVGGLQIDLPKPLPKDIEEFSNSSTRGLVLFSLGTNIRSSELGPENQKMFLNALAQIPEYNFIWKFETSDLPAKLPKNVQIRNFLPQNDILAHPGTRAFISHGGMLSSHESTWHGIPMITVPFLADQFRNSYNLVRDGVAETIKIDESNTAKIKQTILRVLENPKYLQNMQLRSQRFRDQKERPIDRAVWWTNWILRNPKPEHILSPVQTLGHFQANLFDIYLVCFVFLLLFVIIFCKLFKWCCVSKNKVKIN